MLGRTEISMALAVWLPNSTNQHVITIPLHFTETVIGNYRLLGQIGRGGMGTVYRAVQISMDREGR